MGKLAARLSGAVHHPVKDATGLRGKYDFDLYWVSDTGIGDLDRDDNSGSNVSRALQEQLGLKLVPLNPKWTSW